MVTDPRWGFLLSKGQTPPRSYTYKNFTRGQLKLHEDPDSWGDVSDSRHSSSWTETPSLHVETTECDRENPFLTP